MAGCLILAFLAACDNVKWGGADLTIVPPPPRVSGLPAARVEPGTVVLPEGPILYLVQASASGGRMTPVAEISGDSLLPLRANGDERAWVEAFMGEHLRPGSEFVLFHNGARAGTFVTQSATPAETLCGLSAQATGLLELAAGASAIPEFLALARVQAPQIQRRTAESPQPTRTMRVLAPILADHMLRARRSPLPTSWERALAQLYPFSTGSSPDLAFTATYLVGDTLGPGLDDEGQALFFVALPAGMGYDTVFVRFHDYASGGKAASRVIDGLDWDRDDVPELLLRVYATDHEWLEAVGVGRNGQWRILMSDRCEPRTTPTDTASS